MQKIITETRDLLSMAAEVEEGSKGTSGAIEVAGTFFWENVYNNESAF